MILVLKSYGSFSHIVDAIFWYTKYLYTLTPDHTVFDLITAHTPISALSSNLVFFSQCTFIYFFIKKNHML